MCMLNHEDENFRFVARNSLQKRNVPRSNDQNNFLGYKVKVTGYIDAHVNGGFGTMSGWPQLHRILKKL